MNCENIHKKHTGSHLSKFLKQESWCEIQFDSLLQDGQMFKQNRQIIVKTYKNFLTNSFFQFLLVVSLLHLLEHHLPQTTAIKWSY